MEFMIPDEALASMGLSRSSGSTEGDIMMARINVGILRRMHEALSKMHHDYWTTLEETDPWVCKAWVKYSDQVSSLEKAKAECPSDLVHEYDASIQQYRGICEEVDTYYATLSEEEKCSLDKRTEAACKNIDEMLLSVESNLDMLKYREDILANLENKLATEKKETSKKKKVKSASRKRSSKRG